MTASPHRQAQVASALPAAASVALIVLLTVDRKLISPSDLHFIINTFMPGGTNFRSKSIGTNFRSRSIGNAIAYAWANNEPGQACPDRPGSCITVIGSMHLHRQCQWWVHMNNIYSWIIYRMWTLSMYTRRFHAALAMQDISIAWSS